MWTLPTEVSPDRRLPSRIMNNTRDLVSQKFSERDRVRSKYSSVASPPLRDDRALQLYEFSACALFHRQHTRGKRGHNSLRGTLFTSEYSPGGHYSLVNYVWGDIIHGGTIFTPTTVISHSAVSS